MNRFRSSIEYVQLYFKDWTAFEKAWGLTFALIAVAATYHTEGNLLALVAAFSGMGTVVLAAKGRISTYYLGIINSVLYAYIALQSQFFGEVMLNALFFLPMQFVGLYTWTRNSRDDKIETVEAERLTNRRRAIWLSVGATAMVGYGFFLQSIGGNLPFVDSVSTVMSIIAMILMVRRVMEQWIAWIAVNIVTIYMWASVYAAAPESPAMIVMWTAYLVNSVYGFYNWWVMSQSTVGETND